MSIIFPTFIEDYLYFIELLLHILFLKRDTFMYIDLLLDSVSLVYLNILIVDPHPLNYNGFLIRSKNWQML